MNLPSRHGVIMTEPTDDSPVVDIERLDSRFIRQVWRQWIGGGQGFLFCANCQNLSKCLFKVKALEE